MNNELKQESGWHLGRWVLWVGMALVVYVLSIGPVAVLLYSPPAAPYWDTLIKIHDTVYAPLDVVILRYPSAQNLEKKYITWWFKVCGLLPSSPENRP